MGREIDKQATLIDSFNRPINYLRLSVTDRCDFRCVYCMAEEMQFLPRKQLLSFEEITLITQALIELGVTKVRITGGEPLIRRNIDQLLVHLAQLPGLNELTMTSNGSRLKQYAPVLAALGIKRINVSLDSLQADKFKALTRTGDLSTVLEGIQAAKLVGIKVKINAVILKNHNHKELLDLINFAVHHKFDISFIEEMPLGVIDEHLREKEFISSDELRQQIHKQLPLISSDKNTGGPSRYWQVESSPDTHIGFISPHSNNFCASCNRIRVTADGKLLLCLGNEHSLNLRYIIRQHPKDIAVLKRHIVYAMQHKPEKHHFDLAEPVQIVRFMNTTGG